MFLSVFDIFKIGVGPSSSHTMGPMTAARLFLDVLRERGDAGLAQVRCSLHGSLAFTGKGHGTDRAVRLGLLGCAPDTLDPDAAEALETRLFETGRIEHDGLPAFAFDPENDLIFECRRDAGAGRETRPEHRPDEARERAGSARRGRA